MFLETQGVVEIDDVAHWEFRVYMLNGDIVIWHEPVTTAKSAREIIAAASAHYRTAMGFEGDDRCDECEEGVVTDIHNDPVRFCDCEAGRDAHMVWLHDSNDEEGA